MAATKSSKKKIENKVKAVLKKIRPYIRMHGGDVQLVEVKAGVVKLKICGACVGCPLADLTYNKTMGVLIREEVPQIKKVVIV